MYILGLSSSWGTSRIFPAWSPFEHQLTPALSPLWGQRPKPRRPEEVYTPIDRCSNFTQHLFPPKLPCNIHELFLMIHSTSFIPIVYHIHTAIVSFIYITYSFFHFFGSSWQAGCPQSLVSDTCTFYIVHHGISSLSIRIQKKSLVVMVLPQTCMVLQTL
jgi:hypothetical protein